MVSGDLRSPSVVELTLRPRRVLWAIFLFCASAEVLFFLLDWHVNYGRMVDASPIRNLFNTTREDGMASWFGVTQTALVALTIWLVFFTVRAGQHTRWVLFGWILIALFFTYMAFDDGSEFHERMGSTYKIMQERAVDNANASGSADGGMLDIFPSYPWQIIFVPIFGSFGLFMLAFLWFQYKARFPRFLLLAGISCFVIAVGLDFVEGLDEDHPYNLNAIIGESVKDYTRERFNRSGYTAVRHFQKSLEENLEMFGMTLLWIAFLYHWMSQVSTLQVRIDPPLRESTEKQ